MVHMTWSQDTITTPPSDIYYTTQWMELDTSGCSCTFRFSPFVGYENAEVTAYSFTTEVPLIVKGIAVSMETHSRFYGYPETYPLDKTYEDLSLYQYRSGQMQSLGQTFRLHANDTPIAHYYSPIAYYYSSDSPFDSTQSRPVLPVYEFIFDTFQTVTDTFFVGHTGRTQHSPTYLYNFLEEGDTFPSLYLTTMMMVTNKPYDWPARLHAVKHTESDSSWWSFWPDMGPIPYLSYFIFPIFEIDTTNNSIPGSLADRYSNVFPNPATNEVQVVSSFGMTRIEAYDNGGRQVLARQASGYETTLDVTAWPAGTYLLRITTPMGAVTKKLLVR